MTVKPKCECGSSDFKVESPVPETATTYVGASEYFKHLGQPRPQTLELRYHSYRATCKNCGETYNYTTPY